MEEPKEQYSTRLRQLEELLAEEFGLYAGLLRQGGAGRQPVQQYRNRLVEQLQYHDIIRQKIEHVREFQEAWEQEKTFGGEKGENSLPSLLELSLALLRYARMEYGEVCEQTKKIMLSSNITLAAPEEGNSFEQAIQQLINRLEQDYLELEINEDAVPGPLSPERIRQLRSTFSMKSERDVFALFFEDEASSGEDDENVEPQGQVELF